MGDFRARVQAGRGSISYEKSYLKLPKKKTLAAVSLLQEGKKYTMGENCCYRRRERLVDK